MRTPINMSRRLLENILDKVGDIPRTVERYSLGSDFDTLHKFTKTVNRFHFITFECGHVHYRELFRVRIDDDQCGVMSMKFDKLVFRHQERCTDRIVGELNFDITCDISKEIGFGHDEVGFMV